MRTVSKETQDISIASLESTLHKLSKAADSVMRKSGNTQVIAKRRDAIQIGLESLTGMWRNETFSYGEETLIYAKEVLQEILASVEKHVMKAKEGSAQKTLNERRYLALSLAIASLEERL